MKSYKLLAVLAIVLGIYATGAEAQRKRTPVRRTPPRQTTSPVKPKVTADIIVTKTKVSNQLYNVNAFVDKLGPIAVSIESVEKDAAAHKLKKPALDEHAANKQAVIKAIRGMKQALADLETDFRTKLDLKRFLPNIQGITNLAAESEDMALAGKFVAAKEPLRSAAKKLRDTVALMP